MKIKALELNNFRGFEHLKIDFPESNLAVFIGTNGSGKSSVLDALTKLLANFIVTSLEIDGIDNSLTSIVVSDNDINSTHKTNLYISFKDQQERVFSIKKTWNGAEVMRGSYSLNIPEEQAIPLLVSYDVKRLIYSRKHGETTVGRMSYPQLYALVNSLGSTLSQFNDFLKWFKRVEDDEVRQIRNQNDFNYRDQRLEVVRLSLDKFLGDLTLDDYKNLHIKTSEDSSFIFSHGESFLAINKNGQDFDINQLSDGEKTLIMLVCDIARRLTMANPALENKLEGEGVVMIDEIELHLHPKWQRNVLPALQKTFPNIQFIVTTHSPHVLNSLEAENIFVLQNKDNKITCAKPDATLGRDVNWILEEVMEVSPRPTRFEPIWNEVQALISEGGKENLKKAKQQIDQLIQEFELADDGELNAKLAIIKRKEILKR